MDQVHYTDPKPVFAWKRDCQTNHRLSARMTCKTSMLLVCLSLALLVLSLYNEVVQAELSEPGTKIQCNSPAGQNVSNCTTCFKALAEELLQSDTNVYNLQMTFFSPNGAGIPVFVSVRYKYIVSEDGGTDDADSALTRVYFWSSAIYFFFHPVRIFQFTSLMFSDPSLRMTNLELLLPVRCYNTSNDFLTLLTQRVSLN